jgi:hypothetical protein
MRCPGCGLENPETALTCDCGYAFRTGARRQEPPRLPAPWTWRWRVAQALLACCGCLLGAVAWALAGMVYGVDMAYSRHRSELAGDANFWVVPGALACLFAVNVLVLGPRGRRRGLRYTAGVISVAWVLFWLVGPGRSTFAPLGYIALTTPVLLVAVGLFVGASFIKPRGS